MPLRVSELKKLFIKKTKGPMSYSFSLAMFPNGIWEFRVVDSWQKWSDKDLKTTFQGVSITEAVNCFFRYVHNNNINVKSLREREVKTK